MVFALIMKKIFLLFILSMLYLVSNATTLYPGSTTKVSFEPTTGEHGATWTTDNPTLQLSPIGFTCNITAQAYFGGTATVTCTYKDRIGNTTYTRKRYWTFTCIDTQISIYPTSKSLKIGESFNLTWGFNRTTYITPSIQFTGFDYNVVSVSNSGQVTAKSVGETKIYVKSNLGTNSVICTVKVFEQGTETSSESNLNYDNWNHNNTKTVTLEEAGTLSNHILDNEKYEIQDLTIIGPLNGTDIRLLRDMAGRGISNGSGTDNPKTNGKLSSIDLKEAYFVSGGAWYVKAWGEHQYTSNSDELPDCLFAWCPSISKIRFPKYLTRISNRVTLQCSAISHLAIPPGVNNIEGDILNGGYSDMNLHTLYLPSSLNNIGSIYNCGNLTDIYCYATTPPTIHSSFTSQTNCSNGTLYVPKGCAQAYWQAEGWRDFKEIKESLDPYNTLYIYVGDNGTVTYNNHKIEMKQGLTYTGCQAFEILTTQDIILEITPKEGYSLSLLKLNEQPIDIQKDTNIYNIGKLQETTSLKVYFEESSSINNTIIDNNITYDVYNMQGTLITTNTQKKDIQTMPKGIYFLKSNNKTSKICIY